MDIIARNGSLADGTTIHSAQQGVPDRVQIDLTNVDFVDPMGLVTVAVLAESAKKRDIPVMFRNPSNPDTNRYLARMHLEEALTNLGIYCSFPPVTEHDTGYRIMELQRFSRDEDDDKLASHVFKILEWDDPEDAKTLFRCISEAIDNVCEHSGSEGGWAALQQYRDKSGTRRVAFAVGDSGMGLRASLARANAVTSDQDALSLSVKRGVSGTGDNTRGQGLADLIARVRPRGGHVRLWSGNASALTGPNERHFHTKAHPFAFDGTMIYATLNYYG